MNAIHAGDTITFITDYEQGTIEIRKDTTAKVNFIAGDMISMDMKGVIIVDELNRLDFYTEVDSAELHYDDNLLSAIEVTK